MSSNGSSNAMNPEARPDDDCSSSSGDSCGTSTDATPISALDSDDDTPGLESVADSDELETASLAGSAVSLSSHRTAVGVPLEPLNSMLHINRTLSLNMRIENLWEEVLMQALVDGNGYNGSVGLTLHRECYTTPSHSS